MFLDFLPILHFNKCVNGDIPFPLQYAFGATLLLLICWCLLNLVSIPIFLCKEKFAESAAKNIW